jgi:hypothetical protein
MFCGAMRLNDLNQLETTEMAQWKLQHGLPGPKYYWGLSSENLQSRALKYADQISQIKFLNVCGSLFEKLYHSPLAYQEIP